MKMNPREIDRVLEYVEIELCAQLDANIYVPTKLEIEDMFEFPVPSKPFTLGMRKEDYKHTIHELLEKAKTKLKEERTNRVCSCGRKIKENDIYFVRIEAGEPPETKCDYCVEDK